MTPQDQEFVNIPGVQNGDCMRATIASVLDLPIADVPHFLAKLDTKNEEFWDAVFNFLDARSLGMIFRTDGHDPTYAVDMEGYHLIGGPSPRGAGLFHSVVGKDGEIVFDPHPSRAGLLGNPSEWTFEYLVKL